MKSRFMVAKPGEERRVHRAGADRVDRDAIVEAFIGNGVSRADETVMVMLNRGVCEFGTFVVHGANPVFRAA